MGLFDSVVPKCRKIDCTKDAAVWIQDAAIRSTPKVPSCAGHVAFLASDMQRPVSEPISGRD